MRVLMIASAAAALMLAGSAQAITYTSDGNLSDFTAGMTYATFSNFFAGDVVGPYTPTTATLNSGLRVYDGGAVATLDPTNNWILADFTAPTDTIRVFANIDHLGAQYDGYQYQIWGRGKSGWTQLFDAVTVAGAVEPFTLASWIGTAPTRVNNVVSPGAGPSGVVGYIADFSFGSAYSQYAFGSSTVAIAQGNADHELSAIGAFAVPEPTSWALMITGFGLAGVALRRRRALAI